MLELDSVVKRFGPSIAVNGMSLDFGEREFVVILGPAGAGKSTTLRLIAGLVAPTSGDIRYRGLSLRDVPPERRNFSMVFENYALYSHRSVSENLAFPLRARNVGRDEIKRRVDRMSQMLSIGSLLDRRPGMLSGGQRQRVALGRALIREAFVYLLDEPLSHLDARIRQDVRVQLKAMCGELDATVIHVTQDYREAMSLADRIVVLDRGMIQQIGSPDDVYGSPANEFVATFVGDPPMSLLDAVYVEDGGKPLLRLVASDSILPAQALADVMRRHNLPPKIKVAARAGDVSISHLETAACTVPGEVYVAEAHGYRTIVTVKIGDAHVRLAAPANTAWRVSDRVWLGLGLDNLHVFAAGRAIHHPATGNSRTAPDLVPDELTQTLSGGM